ncbi:hypothetical protein ABMA27_003534 [Loxostege sticticalis]|uniref:Uncharacterized protein n=1 Tax=Loxostege sticticalis TaxID=481309 RepID=A0ABR3HTJ9_LOXSC
MILSTLLVQLSLIFFEALSVTSMGDSMLGPGLWRVVSVGPCEQQLDMTLDVVRRKVNRTHDGFTAKLTTDEEIDDSFGLRVDICKHVDGGCKPYQVLADESLPRYVQKYAADNARDFLGAAGLDPPDFPIPKGEHVVKNYVFDYSELPEDGIYGEFGADAYIVKEEKDIACLHLDLEYKEKEEEDDDDEE